jgi:branched-chain amino acid transport system ATP-binding protein
MNGPVLEINHLEAGYNRKPVLHGVSLTVQPGEIVAIIGPNGAGKSTVLKSVIGMLPPGNGDILYCGSRIDGNKPSDNVRQGIAYSPQGNMVFDDLTVTENLAIGGYTLTNKGLAASRMADIFTLFPELASRRKSDAGDLSGGEKQMLALGRALMLRPKLLLLDEPSLGLSPTALNKSYETIRGIRDNYQTAMLIVEQNVDAVFSIADRVYVMALGKVVAEDVPRNLPRERLKGLFLGGDKDTAVLKHGKGVGSLKVTS